MVRALLIGYAAFGQRVTGHTPFDPKSGRIAHRGRAEFPIGMIMAQPIRNADRQAGVTLLRHDRVEYGEIALTSGQLRRLLGGQLA
ncbi:hypothetical protein GCM10027089_49130 [Nocardia thraciensis]